MQVFNCRSGAYAIVLDLTDVLSRSESNVIVRLLAPMGEFMLSVATGFTKFHYDRVVVAVSGTATYNLQSLRRPEVFAAVTGQKLIELLSFVPDENKPRNSYKPAPQSDSVPKDTLALTADQVRFKQTLSDVLIEGQYTPMLHQIKAAYFKACTGRGYDLSTMRTGKTGSTMLAIEYLLRIGRAQHALILAPLSCVRPVWVDALESTLPDRVSVAVTGTRTQKLKALKVQADIFVTNYESLKLLPEFFKRFKPDIIVIDECTHYANGHSQRTKSIKQFIREVNPSYVWGLTGTPGSDPMKAFAMSKVITPNSVACNTESAWRNLTMYQYGPESWMYRPNSQSPALIQKALSPAVLFKKDDLFELPPIVYTARQAECSAQQTKIMNRLRDDMIAAIDDDTVKAQQKSALVSKLMQCAAGAVYTDSGAVKQLEITKRVDAIEELIGEAEGKTVIFSPFTGCIHRLCEELQSRVCPATGKPYAVAIVEGSTSEKARADIFYKFQAEAKGHSEVDVLIAHPRTTAFGVELSAADMMIFDGAPLSGDFVFGQAVERLSSLKQKARQITIAQVYVCAEERKVFNALLKGQSQASIVAELFKNVTKRTE